MAPHAVAEEAMVANKAEEKPISTIVIVIAMQEEAVPLVNKFNLSEDLDPVTSGKVISWNLSICWSFLKESLGSDIMEFTECWEWDIVSNQCGGRPLDNDKNVSLVYCNPRMVMSADQALQPDLIINAGTAGGFKARGASVGDVYIASDVAFHDRRIPIPVFDLYGIGARRTFSTPNLLKELNLKVGKLSTGDSLDMSPEDEASITANDATLKDMEASFLSYLLSVPAIFIKAVTDIIDGDKPTAEEFRQNLAAVTVELDRLVTQVVDFISGKCLSEL
ncbi:Nucleoside phosphorylase domain [Macleaya cordata]|uniref:Nucleoside phosphorylase domain n=1 Tax=Macleaya cordata TaxID=56857 RepID=A0A200Q391_MACCD|nr:Nucleoside phosphorylase domain [Macleaya cordata]